MEENHSKFVTDERHLCSDNLLLKKEKGKRAVGFAFISIEIKVSAGKNHGLPQVSRKMDVICFKWYAVSPMTYIYPSNT